ncbi:DNA-directed RNA polymerase subunit beta [Mangrovibacillus cuniculi]|uniref:DNA-directed RNA polymerase subunit beta n=1 Tax=Mangrovibacillus cuniculi TaxID=2593652 RepID=A0A7S8HG71_9BACI|nr:DNA-directed RNA polymerase subunit beta [Mangrovibacillus cuniculi]QPC47689.1 DNA-directed RNA polymerase subunit beta [Mangrovibacillus cuniculi]
MTEREQKPQTTSQDQTPKPLDPPSLKNEESKGSSSNTEPGITWNDEQTSLLEKKPIPEEKTREEKRKERKIRVRLFPIWLRVLLFLLLLLISIVSGVLIGYGVIGDGSPSDALSKETWQHIIDLVVKEK